jgi:nucleotide-binding universal stress UspA family protein
MRHARRGSILALFLDVGGHSARIAERERRMDDIRKILVPIDFSERALVALDCAGELAQRSGAQIDVIHVWRMPTFIPPSVFEHTDSDEVRLTTYYENEIRAAFDALASRVAKRGVAISGRRIECGEPFQVIVDAAKTGEYDLIVMSTRGRSGLSRVLLGSVAARVLQHAPCPVMTVGDSSE